MTAAGPANPAPATTPLDLDPSQTPVTLAAVSRTEAPRQESSNLSAPQPAAPASQLSASSDAATLTAHSARRRNAGVKVKSWKCQFNRTVDAAVPGAANANMTSKKAT